MNSQDALALDARIAIEFFGVLVNDASYEYDRYSTDWNDMARVVEHLRKRGWLVKMQEMPDNIAWVPSSPASALDAGIDAPDAPLYQRAYAELWQVRPQSDLQIYALADTLPEAVCRAALKTLTAAAPG